MIINKKMNLKYEIKVENLKKIEIKEIALDKDKFGAVTFDKAYPRLNELRKMLVEFDELGYRDLLAKDEVNDVDNNKGRLLGYVKRIYDLNPGTDPSFGMRVRDNLENEIEGFCNSATRQLRGNLVFLRQEAARKSKGGEELAEQQKAAAQAEQKYKELAIKLEGRLSQLEEKEEAVKAKRGEVAALTFGTHFENEAGEQERRARRWIIGAVTAFAFLLFVVFLNIYIYLNIYELPYHDTKIFTPEYGVLKFALVLLLSYAVGFCSRQYNINSNLATTNNHRKNVAETVKDFYASGELEEIKTQIVSRGIEAMFKHLPVGYIRGADKENGPILQFIDKLPNVKSRE